MPRQLRRVAFAFPHLLRGYKEYAEVQWPLVTGTINSIIRRVACEERLPLFSLVNPFFKVPPE